MPIIFQSGGITHVYRTRRQEKILNVSKYDTKRKTSDFYRNTFTLQQSLTIILFPLFRVPNAATDFFETHTSMLSEYFVHKRDKKQKLPHFIFSVKIQPT